MRVLVTRPEPEASALAARIAELGHTPVLLPLTRLERIAPEGEGLEEAGAWILTSARAAPTLSGLPQRRVFAVGKSTAAAAQAAGARDIMTGSGGWRALGAMIIEQGLAAGTLLVHLAGAEVRGGLAELIEGAGLGYRRLIVYRMVPLKHAVADMVEALGEGGIDAVTLLSPRAAHLLADLIKQHGLQDRLADALILCLSPTIAEIAQEMSPAQIRISMTFDAEALLRRLDG